IPMWANVEFDFIRREVVIGGLAGSWFVHLSAALVSGLFFSTLLTLIMVPVMITAPTVMWKQMQWLGSGVGRVRDWVMSPLARKDVAVPAGFDGMALEVPEGEDSAKRYIVSKDAGLTEKEANGVTVVSRRDAAE